MAKKENKPPRELIIDALREKAGLKQSVFRKTFSAFEELKNQLQNIHKDLEDKFARIDPNVSFEYRELSEFGVELKFGGDLLIFYMHTNIFGFDKSHGIWKTTYVKDDPLRSYCGAIHVYNFLNDSFKYNRLGDMGYLIARIFINNEDHYFIEGKRQLGFLYNDFAHAEMDKKAIQSVIESAILYSIDFDLLTPPYDNVKEVTVHEMMEISRSTSLRTGKRLGFRFQADDDIIG